MKIEAKDWRRVIDNSDTYENMRTAYATKGTLKTFFHVPKEYKEAESLVTINGAAIANANDCDLVLHQITLKTMRSKSEQFWNELMSINGAPNYYDLDVESPEFEAIKYVKVINKALNWHKDGLNKLQNILQQLGISDYKRFIGITATTSDNDSLKKVFDAISDLIPSVISVCDMLLDVQSIKRELQNTISILTDGNRECSKVCEKATEALRKEDIGTYSESYLNLSELFHKYQTLDLRENVISKINTAAPLWAQAIENREGIHGQSQLPGNIEDAWKWKQYEGILDDITKEPFEKLQEQSVELSKLYRQYTSKLAELSAWYYLAKRTEQNLTLKQALQGWELTVRKIGKGTGKRAPQLKAEARRLMAKCQEAVPAWIMTTSKVVDSMDPTKNQFDIVIIDEASQSDITAFAIAYMAKKIIVVGDDKQVSPMNVGVDEIKVNSLSQMYLAGNIPNWRLYGLDTSFYDLAKTTFQSLMLREHFRCVPSIIGFSNMLSYDGKIKPLRDANDSNLLPAVINYRVEGERLGKSKTNMMEAYTIVSFIMACHKIPEYQNKTFGVISLLGEDQAKLVQRLLFQKMDVSDIDHHRILCGNASDFQGDERDVIFLSMVDSGNLEGGPLKKTSEGRGDSNKKRYNVAVSRAKDQLWIVNSLDPANDLKEGDIRRTLLDYANNPEAYNARLKQAENEAESPFEEEVAKALLSRGYHIHQQWEVGAYRIDMVVQYQNRKIALECDGERYHSGEEKIREDMERQTILERIGWKFIRIRGSDYYRDPDATMNHVISELESNGILPETSENITIDIQQELYHSVVRKAAEIRDQWKREEESATDLSDQTLYA